MSLNVLIMPVQANAAGGSATYLTNSNCLLGPSLEEEQSDVSSEEEDLDDIDSDDVDSEGLDEDETFVPNHRSTVSLAQQHDFIGF
ncbi:hypothetical protein MMC15_000708 [Xylographa vitiligo]|nr:hypothetical protein [Xylographa vitiligo]